MRIQQFRADQTDKAQETRPAQFLAAPPVFGQRPVVTDTKHSLDRAQVGDLARLGRCLCSKRRVDPPGTRQVRAVEISKHVDDSPAG